MSPVFPPWARLASTLIDGLQRKRSVGRVVAMRTKLKEAVVADSAPTPPGPHPRGEGRDPPTDARRSDGFESWATASGPGLLRFAMVITGNQADAHDAVQDPLVAIYSRWRRVSTRAGADNAGSVDAYARRIIVNRHISWWRRHGRRERPTAGRELGQLPQQGDHSRSVSDAIVARGLLVQLPVTQRAAVVLRFYDDLPYARRRSERSPLHG